MLLGDGAAKTKVIAEISGNHNGSLDLMLKSIKSAHEAGADAVKIQTYEPSTMTLDSDRDEFQVRDGLWKGHSLYELYEKAHTPYAWHKEIFDFAKKNNIFLFSTAFDETAVDLLESLDCPIYKIASFEITDTPLIEYVAKTGKPMIISTGMSSLEEIGEAVEAAKRAGAIDITLMHCISAYPTPLEETRLDNMRILREEFGLDAGFSDHTQGTEAALLASMLGATVIEKHFTFSRADEGVDSKFSLEPEELSKLVENIQKIHGAIKHLDKFERPEIERSSLKFRRSLYFSRDLDAGHVLSLEDIRRVRPGFGMTPSKLNSVIGKTLVSRVHFGQRVSSEFLSTEAS